MDSRTITLWAVVIVVLAGVSFGMYNAITHDSKIHQEQVEACKASVYSQATYSAEIVSAEHQGSAVRGKARLQNGFGAWKQYSFTCTVSERFGVRSATLYEGW